MGGQLRSGMMGPAGLDFGAVIQFAGLAGATDDPLAADLLADALPTVERAILVGLARKE